MPYTYNEIAGAIDHALLHPTMTDEQLVTGCQVARDYRVASVCVKPYFVERAAEILAGSPVAVGTVIGFPHGSCVSEVKRYEVENACKAGARELDMVVNHGKVLTMDWDYVRRDIEMVVLEGNRYGAITKVILETDYLDHSETIAQLCSVCEASGAHFVKTSTGFGFIKTPEGFFSYQGATEENIKLMRSVCSPAVGVKASGGVRDLQAVEKFLDLGCARIGTSSTQAIMAEFLKRSGGEPVKSGAENALAELNEY